MNLIVFSHLRWGFVYQRPQHLLSRAAVNYDVIFIEEPLIHDKEPVFKTSKEDGVTVIQPHLRESDDKIQVQKDLLQKYLEENQIQDYIFWFYTPMAKPLGEGFSPKLVIFDVMDQLSAFKFAPKEMLDLERDMLREADLIFTGGRSLYLEKKKSRSDAHLFPSSIDFKHFYKAREGKRLEPDDQKDIKAPKLGYFGVIDERFDIDLIAQAAVKRPDWHFIMIGPVVKIDPETLPKLENIHYFGKRDYKELPAYIAGWDIALIPFAINESTRYISPTKTPEYLAAGKHVISTPIADVVTPYGDDGYVDIVTNADEFLAAAEHIMSEERGIYTGADEYLSHISWDNTWNSMDTLIREKLEAQPVSFSLKAKKQIQTRAEGK